MSVAGYLGRLGVDADAPPTLETLVALHRAHVQQVPYENLGAVLGRPPSVAPADCLERVATTGRAGYCFHQNAAVEAALHALGFAVRRWHGHVWTTSDARDDTDLNHLVLEVSGLPTDDNPGGRWWPDLGLGEGFLEPLPLLPGEYPDGPLDFTIHEVREDGWVFGNDRHGTFTGMEARSLPVEQADVDAAHRRLSAPDGPFGAVLVVQRREPGAQHTLRGCVLTRIDGDGVHRTDLTDHDSWRDGLATLRLPLTDVDDAELRGLFARMLDAHHAWEEAGRP